MLAIKDVYFKKLLVIGCGEKSQQALDLEKNYSEMCI